MGAKRRPFGNFRVAPVIHELAFAIIESLEARDQRPKQHSKLNQKGPRTRMGMEPYDLITVFSGFSQVGGVRVPPGPAPGGGLATSVARKHRGTVPTAAPAPQALPLHPPKSVKRAFRRARLRAHASPNQGTWYRGKWVTADNLGKLPKPIVSPPSTHRRSLPQRANSLRPLRLLSWNAGGLAGSLYQELLAWCETSDNVDAVIIQETHWHDTTDFYTGPWIAMHSSGRADSNEFGRCTGLLFLLKRKLFQDPRLLEVNPGRLALVQAVHRDTQLTISIIGIYQHVWRTGLTTARNRELRQLIWTQLDQTLLRIPSRHCLVVCGDFNTTLRAESIMVGSSVPRSTATADDGLQALLHQHSLCALNTWHCRPHTTFHSHTGDTQIDYVLTRQDTAQAQAREAYPDHLFPVGGDRLSQHFPIRASLPLRPFSHRRAPTAPHSTYDSTALQLAVREHTPLAQELQQRVATRLREVDTQHFAGVHPHVNRILLEETCALFPQCPSPDQRASAQPTYRITARAVWHLYRCLKHPGVCTFRNIFAKWRLAIQFARASRTLRRCSKDHKRQYYIAQVESAAAQGDQRSLYLIVRRLSPRKRQIASRLRSEDGKLLTREEELQAIVKYGNATFAALFDDHPILPLAEDLPIAAASIAAELDHLGISKAVPTPAATWKLCASALGEVLGETLTAHFRQGTSAALAEDWKDCSVVWIPKPNKPPQGISSLRPIGLSSPASEALAGSLRTQLLHSLAPLMQCMPQFAYASQRGTADAIAKAHHHFELVADLLGHARVTRFQHQAGKVRRACTGGVGLSLDLSKAFDGVNRSKIYEAMHSRGVPASVITLVQQLHHHAKYVYRVGTCTGSTLTSNGIKQGCVIAPYLWNYFSLAFLLLLQEQRDLAWIQNLLSLFADDVWGAWLIESSIDFCAAISDIQLILETLETLDMTINFDKTAILLKLVGKDAKQLRRDHLFQKAGQSFLRVYVHGREQGIPVKDQHVYLGTVVTYTRRLERNMQHRLQAARTNYQGLRKLLNGSHHLSVSHRLRLWVACICSSALYSQHVVGVTDKSLRRLTTMLTKHLRAILRLPAHLTHVTNSSIWQQAGLPQPGWTIQQALLRHQSQLQHRAASSPDITSAPAALAHMQLLAARLEAILHVVAQTLAQESAQAPSFGCPQCSDLFISENAVRIHCKLKHQHLPPRLNHHPTTFVPELHSQAGMPACRLCNRQFFRWSHLKQHIETGACHALGGDSFVRAPQSEATVSAPIREPPTANLAIFAGENTVHLPLIKRSAFLTSLHRWEQWLSVPELRAELKNHCAICHMWVADYRHMKQHFNRIHGPHHPTLLTRALDLCATFKGHLRRDSSCIWCGHRVGAPKRHTQQCTPLVQLALATLLRQHVRGSDEHGSLCQRGSRDLRSLLGLKHGSQSGLPGGRSLAEASPTRAAALECTTPHGSQAGNGGNGHESRAGAWTAAPAHAPPPEPHQSPRPSRTAAGRGHQSASSRQELCRLYAQRCKRHPGHAHAHISRLEGKEILGSRAAHLTLAHRSDCVHDQGTHEPGPTGGGNRRLPSQAPCQRVVEPGGPLELSSVEPGGETARAGQEARTPSAHGGHPAPDLLVEGDDWGHNPTIRCLQDSSLPRTTGSAGRNISSGNLFTRFPGARSVRSSGPPHQLLPDKSHRSLDETGHPSSIHDGKEVSGPGLSSSHVTSALDADGRDARTSTAANPTPAPRAHPTPCSPPPGCTGEAVVSTTGSTLPVLRLQGGSNSCYLNSFLYNLATAAAACKHHSILPQVFWEQSGRAHRAQRLMGFKLLGWSEPEQQHDVTELVDFLHGRLASLIINAVIEVRSHTAEGFQRSVQASATKCLALPINPDMHSPDVQELIHAWHATQQAGLVAYNAAPAWLFIQIPRFHYHSPNWSAKLQQAYLIPQTLNIPIFSDPTALQVAWEQYQVVGLIQHHGNLPTSGHYTSAIRETTGRFWLLDDEKAPTELTDCQLDHVSTNVCVITVVHSALCAQPLSAALRARHGPTRPATHPPGGGSGLDGKQSQPLANADQRPSGRSRSYPTGPVATGRPSARSRGARPEANSCSKQMSQDRHDL